MELSWTRGTPGAVLDLKRWTFIPYCHRTYKDFHAHYGGVSGNSLPDFGTGTIPDRPWVIKVETYNPNSPRVPAYTFKPSWVGRKFYVPMTDAGYDREWPTIAIYDTPRRVLAGAGMDFLWNLLDSDFGVLKAFTMRLYPETLPAGANAYWKPTFRSIVSWFGSHAESEPYKAKMAQVLFGFWLALAPPVKPGDDEWDVPDPFWDTVGIKSPYPTTLPELRARMPLTAFAVTPRLYLNYSQDGLWTAYVRRGNESLVYPFILKQDVQLLLHEQEGELEHFIEFSLGLKIKDIK